MPAQPSMPSRILSRGTRGETRRVADVLRKETVGGALLLAGAAIALLIANSPWAAAYRAAQDVTVGPAALHLDLTLSTWAADGLLAVFFFVAGLELKREFVAGDLRDPGRAVVPIAAAVGGVAVPAVVYLLVNLRAGGASEGWAVPTATDIAFALAVLAVVGRHLPPALRTFLLTLAVVDDLIAIVIIATFFTAQLALGALFASLVPLAIFALLVQRRIQLWWLLFPLALLTWVLVHASGVHATVAGVVLALAVPVRPRRGHTNDNGRGLAEHLEHSLRPISAGIAVPVFAFLSAGVALGGLHGLQMVLGDPVAIGVIAGLVVGKPLGIMAATWLTSRFTRASLDENLTWLDVFGLAILSGIGFTVSLLIGELAFGGAGSRDDYVKIAVLVGSTFAAVLATIILRLRNRAYRRIEELDRDQPDDLGGTDSAGPATTMLSVSASLSVAGRSAPAGGSPPGHPGPAAMIMVARGRAVMTACSCPASPVAGA